MKAEPQNKDCPVCGKCLDIDTYVIGEANQTKAEIQPDDITFCFGCRTVLVFNQALNIVVPDADTLYEITHDPDFHRFINKIDNARSIKPNMN